MAATKTDMRADDLIRAMPRGVELRADTEDDTGPIMAGHFTVWDEWYEVDSLWEGTFLERIAKGAARKTIRENRGQIKVLFNHGYDPQIGDKPLGPIDSLREDDTGVAYEVPLLDAPYMDNVLPGLRAGLYGASFRFRVMKDEVVEEPEASDHNPRALPERTIKEFRLYEFGPVTFPASPAATAGLRSLTDAFSFARLLGLTPAEASQLSIDDLRAWASDKRDNTTPDQTTALPEPGAGEDHSDGADTSHSSPPGAAPRLITTRRFTDKEWNTWLEWTSRI